MRVRLLVRLLLAITLGGCAGAPRLLEPTGAPRPISLDPADPGPFGVRELHNVRVRAGDQRVRLDIYYPASGSRAPVALVSHGFIENGKDMAGWGRHLASWGLIAAVPTFPHNSGYFAARNARSANALLDWLAAQGELPLSPLHGRIDGDRRAQIGYSLGGEIAFLAAALDSRIAVVVGLDPVDGLFDRAALAAAPRVKALVLLIRSDPTRCNGEGSDQKELFTALGGPKLLDRVHGADHCTPEFPVSALCKLACGRDDLTLRRIFLRDTTALLLWRLAGNIDMRRWIARLGSP